MSRARARRREVARLGPPWWRGRVRQKAAVSNPEPALAAPILSGRRQMTHSLGH